MKDIEAVWYSELWPGPRKDLCAAPMAKTPYLTNLHPFIYPIMASFHTTSNSFRAVRVFAVTER